jgi:hypothetical protein
MRLSAFRAQIEATLRWLGFWAGLAAAHLLADI